MHVGASGERVWYVAKARLGCIWVVLGCGAVWLDLRGDNDMGQALGPLGVHWLKLCRLASAMAARWVCMWIWVGNWRHPSVSIAKQLTCRYGLGCASSVESLLWQKVRSRGSYTAKCWESFGLILSFLNLICFIGTVWS